MSNENLYKSYQIRHMTLMAGQSERLALETIAFLEKNYPEILKQINNETYNKKEIEEKTTEMFNALYAILLKDLVSVGKYESSFQLKMIEEFGKDYLKKDKFKNLSDELIEKLVKKQSFEGHVLKDFLKKQKLNLDFKIQETFNKGIARGLTTKEIKNLITQNALNVSSRQSTVIARTAATNVLNSSKDEMYKKNDIKRYQYVAILDSRTTDICRGLDGKTYNVDDKSAPRPPQHMQCRSSTIPIFGNDTKIKESYKHWAARQEDKNLLVDKNGNYKQNPKEVQSLNKLSDKEEKFLKEVKE